MVKKSSSAQLLKILKSVNSIFTNDHFVYTTGLHGSVYINKDSLYPHPQETSEVCRILAEKCAQLDIQTVVAPALAGIIVSQWLSFHLSKLKGQEINGVYVEKDPEKTFVFNRGYDKYVAGKKVLVVEDIACTGSSVKKVVDVVREYGGLVQAVGIMVNRNPKLVNDHLFGAPLIVGTELLADAWPAKGCHLCQAKVPINTKMGHGKKFLQSQTK